MHAICVRYCENTFRILVMHGSVETKRETNTLFGKLTHTRDSCRFISN
jgi:hypothetical protein